MSGDTAAGTDEAVLESLLTYAIPQKGVQQLAHHLLARFGDLLVVLANSPTDLRTIDGIGDQAATLLHLVGGITTQDGTTTDDASQSDGISLA